MSPRRTLNTDTDSLPSASVPVRLLPSIDQTVNLSLLSLSLSLSLFLLSLLHFLYIYNIIFIYKHFWISSLWLRDVFIYRTSQQQLELERLRISVPTVETDTDQADVKGALRSSGDEVQTHYLKY